MDERIGFISHKGKSILWIDLSHTSKAELLILIGQVQQTMAAQPRNSLLVLADFNEAQIDKEVATELKRVLVLDRPYVKKAAWLGTASMPHVFYENFKSFSQRDFPTFETREEGLEWLVEE